MPYQILISTQALSERLNDDQRNASWAIIDCRFSLADTEQGRRQYREAHIPGAVYAHLDEDMSGPIIAGKTSRHPLPDVDTFAKTLSAWGIDDTVQVVLYDDWGGAIAARLWWMLRWMGHEAVAVLDGGWDAWLAEGYTTRGGVEQRSERTFTPRPQPHMLLQAEEVLAIVDDPTQPLVDARTPDRFTGKNEPNDPVAGHIPGAVCLFFGENLGPDKHFLPVEVLRAKYEPLLNGQPAENMVFYCGSGVTANHNILAMLHAGLGEARLYAGSWSEWINDPERPVATGEA